MTTIDRIDPDPPDTAAVMVVGGGDLAAALHSAASLKDRVAVVCDHLAPGGGFSRKDVSDILAAHGWTPARETVSRAIAEWRKSHPDIAGTGELIGLAGEIEAMMRAEQHAEAGTAHTPAPTPLTLPEPFTPINGHSLAAYVTPPGHTPTSEVTPMVTPLAQAPAPAAEDIEDTAPAPVATLATVTPGHAVTSVDHGVTVTPDPVTVTPATVTVTPDHGVTEPGPGVTEGDLTGGLAQARVKAEARIVHQSAPALMQAYSDAELAAERDLVERIRESRRDQRWKTAKADAAERERDRKTTETLRKQDARDVVDARKALAAQRRQTSPHAQLASLYRHRSWSLRALAAVVVSGMAWSAVNVQHNIAPGGPGNPLYWFSFLIEGMISTVLVVIMISTNKVAEWGVSDDKRMVAGAELALLALTLGLNTYPFIQAHNRYGTATHAVAPVMIGISLVVHHAASTRYGKAIMRAADAVADAEPPQMEPWTSPPDDDPAL